MNFSEIYQVFSTNSLLGACTAVSYAMATAGQGQGLTAVVARRPWRCEPRSNKRSSKVFECYKQYVTQASLDLGLIVVKSIGGLGAPPESYGEFTRRRCFVSTLG